MFRNPFRKDPGDGFEDWLVSPRGQIRRRRIAPAEAFAQWQSHRDRFRRSGLWPVIVPSNHIQNLEEIFSFNANHVEDAVDEGRRLDLRRYFDDALAGQFEDEEYKMDLDFDPAGLTREAKPAVAQQVVALSPSSGLPSNAWLALVPCREPWEVPAVLGYGDWNACPRPAEHVAVLREWNAKHGAVPLAMGSDTIELLVRPIDLPAEAKRIAIEQFAYCPDIVDQGVGTVEALAASLLGASVWFFWWD